MAIRKVPDCKGLYCGYEKANRLSVVRLVAISNVTDYKGLTVAMKKVTDCQGSVLWL